MFSYDKLNRLTIVDQSGTNQAKRAKMTYNALGQRTLLERYESYGTTPIVANTSYTYDTSNRLSRIEHSKGATVFNAHDYIFDGMSRIKSMTSKIGTIVGQPHTVDFSYDELSQLVSADDGTLPSQPYSQSFSYTYDANGNRNNTGYANDVDNRVKTGPDGESYVYDLEGNLTEIRVNGTPYQRLKWDHRNRLTEVVTEASS